MLCFKDVLEMEDQLAALSVKGRLRSVGSPGVFFQCQCGCRDMLKVESAVRLEAGEISPGLTKYLCFACFAKGRQVVVHMAGN